MGKNCMFGPHDMDVRLKKKEFVTFNLGKMVCGIDVLAVQEINKNMAITPVPLAPEFVAGILNLRGRIVTVIDLGKKVGLASDRAEDRRRNIIITQQSEPVGLLVDGIGDVVDTEAGTIERPPANMGELHGKFIRGVIKTEPHLILILSIEQITM